MGSEENKPGSRERNLIEEALRQAGARPEAPIDAGEELPPAETFPGYDLIRELHRGGQGVVYLAIQRATKRRVAIKVMHEGPFAGSSGRARFEREVQILGQLNHPNIVHIHDSGTTPSGGFFYVMDYVSGKGLDELIQGRSRESAGSGSRRSGSGSGGGTSIASGRLDASIEETLKLFARICGAVNAAHLKGVIHRDLKPSNIRVDANGEPIVVDFGLARVAVPDLGKGSAGYPMTMTGQFIGSLPWASPEQAEGVPDKIDVRTDVYSLGVILYQLLTGAFPYQVVGNMRDVLDNILRAEPARPSTIRRQINDEVETIVLKCLHKDRDRRYQTAGEIERDVRRYLAGAPIEAKRDSGLYILRKTLRRYAWQSGAAGAGAAGLVVFAIVVTILWGAAERASNRATAAATKEKQERERAEENAQTLRSLARKVIYDLDARFEELPGATVPREELLREVREHLARLQAQAGEDPALLREVADTHDLLGDVQGGLLESNIGRGALAAESYEAASTIREELLRASPGDPRAIADVAQSRSRLAMAAFREGRYADATGLFDAAVAGYDEALRVGGAALPPLVRAEFEDERAGVWLAWSRIPFRDAATAAESGDRSAHEAAYERATGLISRARSHWERRASAIDAGPAAARFLAECDARVARFLIVRGLSERALARALVGAGDPGAAERFASARDLFSRAATSCEPAVGRLEAIAGERPADVEARRALMVGLHHWGEALMWAAEVTAETARAPGLGPEAAGSLLASAREGYGRAMAILESGAELARELLASDPVNLRARRDLGVMLNKLTNCAIGLREWDSAVEAGKGSLLARRTVADADPLWDHRMDVTVGIVKLGDVYRERAGDGARTLVEREVDLSEAKALAGEGIAYAEALAIERSDDRRAAANLAAARSLLELCEKTEADLRAGGG